MTALDFDKDKGHTARQARTMAATTLAASIALRSLSLSLSVFVFQSLRLVHSGSFAILSGPLSATTEPTLMSLQLPAKKPIELCIATALVAAVTPAPSPSPSSSAAASVRASRLRFTV